MGSAPLLAIGAALGPEPTLLATSSLGSHALARLRGRRSTWLHTWGRPDPHRPVNTARYGRAELGRAGRFMSDTGPIAAAVACIAREVHETWDRTPASLVVIWERRRALGSLVARRALAAGVPVVTVQNGFAGDTILVDRLVSEDRLLLGTRDLERPDPSDGAAPQLGWRRPAGLSAAPAGFRIAATAGLWLDYAEKLARAATGRPALIPLAYWTGYLRARARRGEALDRDTRRLPPDRNGLVVVALHSPPAIGTLADPWELVDLCLDRVPPEKPLAICPHPGDRNAGFPSALESRIAARPNTFVVRNTPTWRLLDRTALLVTLTSSIGIEGLTRGLPTLAIESATYARPGLAEPLGEAAGAVIAAAAVDPGRFAPDPGLVEAFLRTAFREHLVPGRVHEITPAVAKAVAGRLRALAGRLP